MLQITNAEMLDIIISRIEALQSMYFFDLVQAEISEIVDKFNSKEHIDPAIYKNIDQIQVIN